MFERLISGTTIADSDSIGFNSNLCDFFVCVKKMHEECGDSAFVYSDEKKLIAGVFDGVSGEPNAASASSIAASTILDYLKNHNAADEKLVEDALLNTHTKIKKGFTTATILFLEKGGKITLGGVGDSPVYCIRDGIVHMELYLARVVGHKHSILKFFSFRNLVTSVLGPSKTDIHVAVKSGRLKKGDLVILATDGLLDNLYFEVEDGYIIDPYGTDDIKQLVRNKKNPKTIANSLIKTIEMRISKGKIEEKTRIIHPKSDDVAIACIAFK